MYDVRPHVGIKRNTDIGECGITVMNTWTVPGYSEVRELGSGATGHVIEAVHDASGQHVAIKYLSSALANDEAFLERFRDEARLLVELDMPNVVRMFEYVEEPGLGAAIVMELVEGASLHDLIAHRGPTIPESALAVLKGSLLGLAAAHALGVVHRDYKPENVLVDSTGNSKLADFGIAVQAGRRVAAVGTPLYMAPEQWTGGEASPATDIYAATAVFYECLTGKPPYSGGLRQLRREHETSQVPTEAVPAPLRNLVVRGMAKDPADRPTNAMAFVVGLEQVAVAAYGPDWEERGRRHLAERTAALLLLLLGGGVVGAATGATAATFLGRRRVQIITAAAAVLVVAGTTIGIAATSSGGHNASSNGGSHGHTNVTPLPPSAAASVAPATLTAACTSQPGTFTFSGSITAKQAGAVTYQWVFSTGQTSSPQTLHFSAPGTQPTVSQTLTAHATVHGWAQLQVTSPAAVTSNQAAYQLTCTHKPHKGPVIVVTPGPPIPPIIVAASISAAAHVAPASSTITCGAGRPAFIFSGSITTNQAGSVTYHWAFSNGTHSATHTLTFGGAGTKSVVSDSFTPPADKFTGSGKIVVTGPVGATSNAATFALSCVNPMLAVKLMSSPPSPATFPCGSQRPGFEVFGTIQSNQDTTITYHFVRSDGTSTPSVTTSLVAGQPRNVKDFWLPPADNFSGHDGVQITAPVSQLTSIPITLSCTGSHVIDVSIVQGPPQYTDPSQGLGFITFTVTVTTEGTDDVTVDWSAAPAANASGTDTGSVPLFGQTSYQFLVNPPSGFFNNAECPPPPPGQPQPSYVLDVTATGTDNVAVHQSSSFTLNCTG